MDRLKRHREGQVKIMRNPIQSAHKTLFHGQYVSKTSTTKQSKQNVNYDEDTPANENYDEPAEEERSKHGVFTNTQRVEFVKKLADLNFDPRQYRYFAK